jgi:hypothetical protein
MIVMLAQPLVAAHHFPPKMLHRGDCPHLPGVAMRAASPLEIRSLPICSDCARKEEE